MGPARNFFLSYDLNGKTPSHAEMDKHIRKLGCPVERVLETVWYVHTLWDKVALYEYVNSILSINDRVLVVDANDAMMRNLLVPIENIQGLWNVPLALPMAPRPPAARFTINLASRSIIQSLIWLWSSAILSPAYEPGL